MVISICNLALIGKIRKTTLQEELCKPVFLRKYSSITPTKYDTQCMLRSEDYQLQAAQEASAFRLIALFIEKPQTGIHDVRIILGSTTRAYFIDGML